MTIPKSFISLAVFAGLFIANTLYAQPIHSVSTSVTPVNTVTLSKAERVLLSTVAAIDKNEILVSVVALHKNPDAKLANFANMMIKQHGDNLTKILVIANALQALPLVSKESEAIAAQGQMDLTQLGGLKDKAFQIAYVNAMVTGHQAALDLIDHKLMQTAVTPAVKKFLVATRAVVAQHLIHAKALQASLK